MCNGYLILLNNYTYNGIKYQRGSVFQIAYAEELPPYYLAKHIEDLKRHEKLHAIWIYDENDRGAVCLPFDLVEHCQSWETARERHFDLLSDTISDPSRRTMHEKSGFAELPETARLKVEKFSTASILIRACSAFFDQAANSLTVITELENVTGVEVSTELYFSVFTKKGDLIDAAQCHISEFARISTNKHIFRGLQSIPYQVHTSPSYCETPESVHSSRPLRNPIPTKKGRK